MDVGIPLSMAQYTELTAPALVMRLVATHKHMLASRIAEALGLREERARVLLHWVGTLPLKRAGLEELQDSVDPSGLLSPGRA